MPPFLFNFVVQFINMNEENKPLDKRFGEVLVDAMSELNKQVRIILKLDADPSISEEDKEKIFNAGEIKVEAELQKIKESKKRTS